MGKGEIARNEQFLLFPHCFLPVPFSLNLKMSSANSLAGRLSQLVERRTREHNISGHYRCGCVSPAGQLKLLIVFRQSPIAELSFVTLTVHLCNGPNDKNLVKPRKTCFLSV